MRTLASVGRAVLGALFPPTCLGCDRGFFSVERTATQNDPYYPLLCNQCYADIRHGSGAMQNGYFVGGASPYDNGAVRSLVQALKFQGVRSAAVPLGCLISRYLGEACLLARTSPRKIAFVPIPLGIKRFRERGFNQAVLIARNVSQRTSVPILENVIQRVRDTDPQTDMKSKEARLYNMVGSFAVVSTIPDSVATLVVVDDVSTSGATFVEAAAALRTVHRGTIICVAATRA
jgi:predicted amidophosphoribosyltransferase